MKTTETNQTATYHEIVTQPKAWREALTVVTRSAEGLKALWAKGDYTNVIFTGCGSTYYLALAAAALFQELTGRLARGVPAGELAMYPATVYPPTGRTMLVAVSRSAETTETVRAVTDFQQHRPGDVITVTNYGERPLAALGTINLVIPAGQEQSVAQTRSFASMYVATAALAALLAGRADLLQDMHRLPDLGQQLISQYEDRAKSWGSNLALDRFYFLGSGPRYGLACEANLKMKEMTLTHSEPFHFLEFRHGPISMVCPTALVIGLLSESNGNYEFAVLQDARQLGGQIFSLGETAADVNFDSRLPEAISNILYLPILQLMACYRSVAKGLNPDRPNNLEAVVKLEWN